MSRILFNLHDVALFITVYSCLTFAVFLLIVSRRNARRHSLRWLAMFLVASACIPIDTLILFGEAFRQWAIQWSPHIFHVFGVAYWVDSVFLLLFVRALISKQFVFRRRDALLFLPFAVYLIYESQQWFFLSYDEKMSVLLGYDLAEEPVYKYLINLFREVFRTGCLVLALYEIRRYHKQLKHEYADVAPLDLTWLTILLFGFIFVRAESIIVTLAYTAMYKLGIEIDFESLGLFNNWMTMIFLSLIALFTVWRASSLLGVDLSSLKERASAGDNVKGITPSEIQRIEQYMQDKKPFLNHYLNLENLAGQLNLSPRHLSQIINRHYEQNFFEFVNRYRIEECKKLLSDSNSQHLNMLDVMDRAGFNSKATFNTFFRKSVGMTPSQYRSERLG